MGIKSVALNSEGLLEYMFVFALGFNFMSPKWTRTKMTIEIFLSPVGCCYPCLVQELYSCQRISHPILIEVGLVPIAQGNENPIWDVLVGIFDNKYPKM